MTSDLYTIPDPWLGGIAQIPYSSYLSDSAGTFAVTLLKTVTAGIAGANEVTTPSIFQYTTNDVQSTVNGNVWDSSYNSSTQKTTTTSPVGRKTYVTSDLYGKPTTAQWATFSPVSYAYDTHGRVSQVTQSTRQSTLAYNTSGQLSSVTDPASETTSFTYDNAGRIVTQTLPDTRVINFGYDANGNLTSLTPPGKSAHSFTLNPFELLDTYLPPLLGGSTSTPTTYAYNNDKQVTLMTRPNSDTVAFTYDATGGQLTGLTTTGGNYAIVAQGGRVSQSDSPDGYRVARTFGGYTPTQDVVSNVATSSTIGTVGWAYTTDFNVTTSTVTPGSGSVSAITYLYDTDALLKKSGSETITRSTSTGLISSTTLSRIADALTYNSTYGELATYSAQYNPASGGPTVLLSESYTRDALGRISSKTEGVNGTSHTYAYTYDSVGRLTNVTRDSVAYSAYAYDSNSNRTSGNVAGASFTGTFDAQDRMNTYTTQSFTYNLNGEMASRTDSATSSTTNYAYDTFGNLKQAVLPTKTVNYKLDGFNRRVAKLTGTTVNNYFLYEDGLRLAALENSSRQITERFIYGSKSNVPDYVVKSGTTYRILSDERGSVRVVVNASTGVVSQQMDYDEFGNVINDTSPGFQPFGFAGCLYDVDTKLCHFDAREYDASTGRWLTKDPILFGGGDTNLYGYVLSDPINFIDPTGLSGTDNYRDGGGGADTGTNVFNTYCKITGKCDQIPMPPPPLIQQFGRRTFDILNPPPPQPPLPPFLPPPLTPKTYQPPNPSCGG